MEMSVKVRCYVSLYQNDRHGVCLVVCDFMHIGFRVIRNETR